MEKTLKFIKPVFYLNNEIELFFQFHKSIIKKMVIAQVAGYLGDMTFFK